MTDMTNLENAMRNAQRAAKLDYYAGRPADVEKHGARLESAWAKWYTEHYTELTGLCPCGNPLDDDPTRPDGICQECR